MSNLYSGAKIFHFQDKLDSLLEGEPIQAPIHIRIKPTNRCNHNCWYCSYRSDKLQLGKDMCLTDEMSRDDIVWAIRDMGNMGVKALTFSGGGEPLLYPHIWESIIVAMQRGLKIGVITNGALLVGVVCALLAEFGSWVRVSMDGWDDASYKAYRGVADYSKIMANMEAFVKLDGNCKLGVVINVSKENASHLYGMAERLKGIGVQSVKFAPCVVDDDAEKNVEYHIAAPAHTAKQAQNEINSSVYALQTDAFQVVDAYDTQLHSFAKRYSWCPMCQIRCVIGADCNVYTCQDKAYTTDGLIGSFKDCSFRDLWFKNKDRFFAVDPSLDCNHHCVANELNKTIHSYLDVDKEHLEFV